MLHVRKANFVYPFFKRYILIASEGFKGTSNLTFGCKTETITPCFITVFYKCVMKRLIGLLILRNHNEQENPIYSLQNPRIKTEIPMYRDIFQ